MGEMSPGEFRRAGYLQEVNRRFLHPLGLALSVRADASGELEFGPVVSSDDREGIVFAGDAPLREVEAEMIEVAWKARISYREDLYGWGVQPIGADPGIETEPMRLLDPVVPLLGPKKELIPEPLTLDEIRSSAPAVEDDTS